MCVNAAISKYGDHLPALPRACVCVCLAEFLFRHFARSNKERGIERRHALAPPPSLGFKYVRARLCEVSLPIYVVRSSVQVCLFSRLLRVLCARAFLCVFFLACTTKRLLSAAFGFENALSFNIHTPSWIDRDA